jgi:hypothetical protein
LPEKENDRTVIFLKQKSPEHGAFGIIYQSQVIRL